MKSFLIVTGFVVPFLSLSAIEQAPSGKHPVMTWVAPYAMKKAKVRLNESFDGMGMKDGLTHLGLQFWSPTKEGGVAKSKEGDEVTDAAVGEFLEWGHANGVKVLLCVFNHVGKWDWPLARSAFGDHPQEFATALAAEVNRLGLDGVDLDLEGEGSYEADKDAYIHFVQILAPILHGAGKDLTVDSFSYVWNAPNQNWWKELFPHVEGITSMGYEEIGVKAPEWRAYPAQKAAAGDDAAKLMIGMPSGRNQWQGNELMEHLNWIVDDGGVGLSFWDAQMNGTQWRSRETWEKIQRVKSR